ncbi:16575_t:CDS:1, partial [Cetraspora pellucida]
MLDSGSGSSTEPKQSELNLEALFKGLNIVDISNRDKCVIIFGKIIIKIKG